MRHVAGVSGRVARWQDTLLGPCLAQHGHGHSRLVGSHHLRTLARIAQFVGPTDAQNVGGVSWPGSLRSQSLTEARIPALVHCQTDGARGMGGVQPHVVLSLHRQRGTNSLSFLGKEERNCSYCAIQDCVEYPPLWCPATCPPHVGQCPGASASSPGASCR